MLASELKELLKDIPDNREIVFVIKPETGEALPLENIEHVRYVPDNPWHGKVLHGAGGDSLALFPPQQK